MFYNYENVSFISDGIDEKDTIANDQVLGIPVSVSGNYFCIKLLKY